MIPIDKDIKIPPKTWQKGLYPWKELEIGDSFLIGPASRNGMNQSAKRYGFKIVTRREGEKVRVWRIA